MWLQHVFKSFRQERICQKKYDPKVTVEKGNQIVVSHIATHEQVDIHVTDAKNPYYLKQLNNIILIKRKSIKLSQ